MGWTETKPSAAGWYWYLEKGKEPVILRIFATDYFLWAHEMGTNHTIKLENCGGLWHGPFEPPQIPSE